MESFVLVAFFSACTLSTDQPHHFVNILSPPYRSIVTGLSFIAAVHKGTDFWRKLQVDVDISPFACELPIDGASQAKLKKADLSADAQIVKSTQKRQLATDKSG